MNLEMGEATMARLWHSPRESIGAVWRRYGIEQATCRRMRPRTEWTAHEPGQRYYANLQR